MGWLKRVDPFHVVIALVIILPAGATWLAIVFGRMEAEKNTTQWLTSRAVKIHSRVLEEVELNHHLYTCWSAGGLIHSPNCDCQKKEKNENGVSSKGNSGQRGTVRQEVDNDHSHLPTVHSF